MMRIKRKDEHGIAAIELGLVIPVLFIILFGIFEFGLAFWRKQTLTGAVREGARKGIVATQDRKTCDEVTQAVKTYLTNMGWDPDKGSYEATGGCATGTSGDDLVVTASYPTSFLILSRLGLMKMTTDDSNGNILLEATITMQME